MANEALEQWMKEAMKTLKMQKQNLMKQHTITWVNFKKKQQAKIGLDGIAQECASYNPYNSKHLKSCIADALETGEFQRRNNVIDGSTSVTVACEVIA